MKINYKLSIILLVLAISSNYLASHYIEKYYKMPIADDIILSNIKYNPTYIYVYNIVLVSSIAIFLIINGKNNLPYYIFIIAIFFFIRAFFMMQTPLLPPRPEDIKSLFPSYGLYPSGHTAIMVFLTLFIYKRYRKWILLFILLTIVEILALLKGFGHYSIDISVSIFISYAIYKFLEKYEHNNNNTNIE